MKPYWREEAIPKKGMQLDLTEVDGEATDIYLTANLSFIATSEEGWYRK